MHSLSLSFSFSLLSLQRSYRFNYRSYIQKLNIIPVAGNINQYNSKIHPQFGRTYSPSWKYMQGRKKERRGAAKGDRKQITAVRLLSPHAKSRSVIFPVAKPPRQAFPRLFRPTLTRHFPFYSEESFVSRKPLSKRLSTKCVLRDVTTTGCKIPRKS